LKTATEYCRTKQQIQRDDMTWRFTHTSRITQQWTTPARELSGKWYRRRNDHFNPLQISCLGSDARSFLKASSDAKTVSEIKVALEQI